MELKRLLAIYRRALLKVISIANLWVYLGSISVVSLGSESDVYLRSLYWWFLVIAVCLLQAGILGNLLIARCVLVRICISLLDAYSYAYAYGQGFLGIYTPLQ